MLYRILFCHEPKRRRSRAILVWLVTFPPVLSPFLCCRFTMADEYFNPAALELSSDEQKITDLSYFSNRGGQKPGSYQVDIFVDDALINNQEVEFVEKNNELIPVLTIKQLDDMGINVKAFPTFSKLHDNDKVTQLAKFIPGAFTKFDFAMQRLNISVPQVALKEKHRGYIDPSRWDNGVNAAFVNYNYIGSSSKSNNNTENTNFVNLRGGINLGPWRLRNIATYRYDKIWHWQSQSVYAQRDIIMMKSLLRVGDTYTSGELFDSVQFQGIQIFSDDNMLPDSERGFAPVIRGIAHSNAKITVSQRGYVIYETFVAPGAFEIKDLYPTSQSGDLYITIKESDGTLHKFIQPYSAVPYMLRKGRMKYSLSVGRYHYSHGDTYLRRPKFLQSTLFYGLPFDITLYGGVQLADDYRSMAIGAGRGFGEYGSLGVDATVAQTDLPYDGYKSGQSVRAQYQKDFTSTQTTFTMASYRYSSSGFYTFNEANEMGRGNINVNNTRSRSEVSVSQDFSGYGNFTISAYTQNYWRSNQENRTIHIGYNNKYKSTMWGLGYFYTTSSYCDRPEQAVSFYVDIPLHELLPDSSISYSLNNDNKGNMSQQLTLQGAMLEDRNLYYSVQQGYESQGNIVNNNVSLDYHGSIGEATLGYSNDKYNHRINYGLAGGVVAHSHGITLSQPLGDTFGIVSAPGAGNVKVQSADHVHTNKLGYAVVPALSPFHKNDITIDTTTLGDNVDVDSGAVSVVPDNGAIVMADFNTHIGNRVLFTLTNNNIPLPFGAIAVLNNGGTSTSGIVADKGQLYLSGVPTQGIIEIKWNTKGQNCKCHAHFSIHQEDSTSGIITIPATCQ